MKKFRLFALLCFALLAFVGCKKDDPATEKGNETFFYVKYSVNYVKPYDSNELVTMVIVNAEGKKETFNVEDKEIKIGPVYAGFEAKLSVSNPAGGYIRGSIEIARNSDWANFWDYGNFSSNKYEESISYKILPTTGL